MALETPRTPRTPEAQGIPENFISLMGLNNHLALRNLLIVLKIAGPLTLPEVSFPEELKGQELANKRREVCHKINQICENDPEVVDKTMCDAFLQKCLAGELETIEKGIRSGKYNVMMLTSHEINTFINDPNIKEKQLSDDTWVWAGTIAGVGAVVVLASGPVAAGAATLITAYSFATR